MATPRPRIPIPGKKDPSGILALANMVLAKHQADGPASVIRGQLKTDLEAAAFDITEGVKDDAEAAALLKTLEEIFERRDNRAFAAHPLLQRTSKALQSEYGPKNLRRMGDHGYVVDDSPRPPKPPTAPKKGGPTA